MLFTQTAGAQPDFVRDTLYDLQITICAYCLRPSRAALQHVKLALGRGGRWQSAHDSIWIFLRVALSTRGCTIDQRPLKMKGAPTTRKAPRRSG